MEFVEEDSRPRFLFQSRPSPSIPYPETLKPSKLHIFSCFASSILLLFISFYFFESQTLTFVLVWTALSLLVAPFAPSSATGGDPRVGLGDPLPPPPLSPQPDLDDRTSARRTRSRTRPENPPPTPAAVPRTQDPIRNSSGLAPAKLNKVETFEEESKEWTDEDFEVLKKQISKHPVGEPRRWEKIAEGFRGRHGLESVIKMGKSLSERRPDDKDWFAQFLKQRKPVDKRVETADGEVKEKGSWSSGEDIALLNALKVFPKDVSMRWEKVAAAVPGRSKSECMKRVAELKKDFRSSKASES